ncbi:MAG: hypothetical protein IRZ11_00805 [Clostridia bacterium]|nr:hypothetical protein [Clostridia bacterium]
MTDEGPAVRERALADGLVWIDAALPEGPEADLGRHPAVAPRLGRLPEVVARRLGRPFERPRVTAERDAVYLAFLWPARDERGRLAPTPFGLLLWPGGLLTVHRPGLRPTPEPESGRSARDAVLHGLLEQAVGQFEALAQELARVAEAMSDRLQEPPPRPFFYRVLSVREEALRLRHVLGPARAALELLRSPHFPLLGEAWRPFFDDLADRLQQLIDDVEDVRLSLRETLEAHTTIHNDRQNDIMKVLTVISTFTLPTTLVASIYGMNFRIPEYAWPHGYEFALGLMSAMMLGLFGYLRWRGWFG